MSPEPESPTPTPTPSSGPDGRSEGLADRVRDRALSVAGVVDLAAGLAGEIATYLPGRQVPGVRLHPDRAEVHVVVDTSTPLPVVAAELMRVVRELGFDRVDVHIDDLREIAVGTPGAMEEEA